jgi:hypothetical protein
VSRDRFVDVDRAADLEDGAAFRELDRRIEAVGRHDRVSGMPREPPSLTETPAPTVFAVPIAAPPSTTAEPSSANH